LHDSEPQFTPYIYSGLSFIHYNGLYFSGGAQREDSSKSGIALPMIVGFKGRLADSFVLGFEVGARMAFKDDLDGSNPSDNGLASLRFGNTNSNDWYVFTGLTLTYTFGNKPCFCAD